jgi:hypothetical protein
MDSDAKFEFPDYPANPSRYQECIEKVDETLKAMPKEELMGAYRIMKKVSEFFWELHFNKYAILSQRGVVKTLDEITENLCQELHQNTKKDDGSGPRHYFPT